MKWIQLVPSLALMALSSLMGIACHGYRASTQQITDPGLHVISSPAAQTLVWSDGRTRRSCTLSGSGSAHGKYHGQHTKGHGGARGSSPVDAALFRLCEARGNGDLSQEQYVRAVEMVLAHMARGVQPSPPMTWGPKGHGKAHPHGKWHPHGTPGGQAPGQGCACPHCPYCKGMPKEPGETPVPEAPVPQSQSL